MVPSRLGHLPATEIKSGSLIETVSGRIDMLNSSNSALRNVTVKPAPAKPCRIRDLTPRNGRGSNVKGHFRYFMSDLHLWVQAWSDEGETRLVSVESTSKLDNSTLAVDCSGESSDQSRRHSTGYCTERQQTNRFQSMARDPEEIRSEEHVRHKYSICSTDQQHL